MIDRLDGIQGQSQRACEHVHGSARDDPQCAVGSRDTVRDLVDVTVTAERDHELRSFVRGSGCDPDRGVARFRMKDLESESALQRLDGIRSLFVA
jgi:hypothetical protein